MIDMERWQQVVNFRGCLLRIELISWWVEKGNEGKLGTFIYTRDSVPGSIANQVQ
jgi:hypothetical protein